MWISKKNCLNQRFCPAEYLSRLIARCIRFANPYEFQTFLVDDIACTITMASCHAKLGSPMCNCCSTACTKHNPSGLVSATSCCRSSGHAVSICFRRARPCCTRAGGAASSCTWCAFLLFMDAIKKSQPLESKRLRCYTRSTPILFEILRCATWIRVTCCYGGH